MRHRSPAPARRSALTRPLAVIAAPLLIAVACATWKGLPHGWWDARGPVVPHDTFPADCRLCHEGEGWNSIRADFQYDHEQETGVALAGAHAQAECLRCHNDRGPVALFAARGCAGCHEDVHLGQLGRACEDCHDQESWRPQGQIARHALTRFPLVGAHAATQCLRCHPGAEAGLFTPTDPDCAACHTDDALAASNPNHAALGWVANCERCHTPTGWTGSGFHHSFFPLTGAHAAADCEDCHTSGIFAGLPSDCYACHAAEYAAAQDPDHVAAGISTDCAQCHGTSTWQGARFSHAGISSDCVSCHLPDWVGAKNPDHAALGIPQTCEDCHNTNSWQGAGFNHSGITNGCAVCHMPEYNATTDPNHAAAGFPTSCELCHDTNDWGNANFSHPWFPINSGPHARFDCSDCHLNPNNFGAFSCTHCHEHRRSKMADTHNDVNGYVWQSSACLACHPDGRE